MTNTDYTAFFQNLMSGKAFDMPASNDMFATMTSYQAQLNKIALDAAEKNAELSYEWMKDTLSKMEVFADAKTEPAEAAKAASEVLTASVRSTPEHVAKFAEVAKKAQTQTVELLMNAGKEAQNAHKDASAPVAGTPAVAPKAGARKAA